ncbi:MAG: glycosyltransferase [Balneola sp.]|nr:glycosyltransferase [Balneola sp.]
MSKKLVYVGFAFDHHKNSEGGYHHIRKYIDYDFAVDLQKEREFPGLPEYPLLSKVIRKIKNVVLGNGLPIGMLRLLYLNLTNKNLVFHFIYPENSYKWLGKFKRKNNRIAFTLHQPFVFYNNPKWKKIFEESDLIIVLKKEDVNKFKELTGSENIFYVPHGINTNYFKPINKPTIKNRILMVGNWMRNFELASNIFVKLRSLLPDIDIVVVTNKVNFKYFDADNVNLVTSITNEELLNYYQTSKIVYFPLDDFTANNALLEAAGCGCHIIISTPMINITEYFPSELIKFTNEDIQTIVDTLIEILNEEKECNHKLAKYTQAQYSWDAVGRSVEKLLSNIS